MLQTDTAPEYVSTELSADDYASTIRSLKGLGYYKFKLINQETHTHSLPIFQHEVGARLLRKLCHYLPPIRRLIHALPEAIRPSKVLFDPPRLKACDSGPFGEEAEGPWLSVESVSKLAEWMWTNAERDGIFCWYDIHAKR